MLIVPTLTAHERQEALATAHSYADQGTCWLHLTRPTSADVASLAQALAARDVALQAEARSLGESDALLQAGVARVVIEAAATDLLADATDRFGAERILPAFDLKEPPAAPLGEGRLALVRDRERPDVAALGALAQHQALRLLVQAEVGTLDGLRRLRWIEPYGLVGVVLGEALRRGNFTLAEALAL